MPLRRILIRAAVSSFQTGRRTIWFFTRPLSLGAHAVAVTERGTLVLLKQTYTRGWRLPGGGLKANEAPQDAALRELREEIGLLRYSTVTHVGTFHHRPDFRRGIAEVFLVRDVEYDPPHWSLEVQEVCEFEPDRLPPDLPAVTRDQLRLAGVVGPDR